MTALLTANTAAVLSHVLVDVLVAYGGLCVANPLLIKSLVQTKVGHDSGDHRVVHQFAVFLHVATIDVQDMVAGNNIALLVHTQAAVSIAIKGKANIQTVLYHELLQALDMGRASIIVNVQAVRLVVDDIGIRTQSIKNRLSDIPACTVGAVQTNLHALEGIDAQADQVAHVAVTACHIVLHQQQGLLGHLLTVAVDQLDAVIVVGVVAGRDHDAAIKVIHTSNIGNRRSSGDMKQVGICARSGQACNQTILEHIGAAAGVLANDDASRLVVTVALTQGVVIPAQKATNLVGMVGSQINTSFATEAVSSKILSHS